MGRVCHWIGFIVAVERRSDQRFVPLGFTGRIRSTIVRDGNDAYLFTVFVNQNGEWKQMFQITYKRMM